MKYLVILVREQDHSYQVDVLDEQGEPTGGKEWTYGPFWTFVQSLTVTGEYDQLINEQAQIYLRDGVRFKAHVFPASRFPVSDYDAWALGMRQALTAAGIVFEADTVEKPEIQGWIAAMGFVAEGAEP